MQAHVVHRPHPAGLLRDRLPGDGAVPRGPLAAHRRPALQGAGQALVEGDADPVRHRRRDRHDPLVRDGAAVAGVHGHLRRRVRARPSGSRASRSSSRRSSSPSTCTAGTGCRPACILAAGFADRARRHQRVVHGDLGERLDEPADRLPRSRTARSWTCEPLEALFNDQPLARARPHVPGRVHRGRLPGGRRVRGTAGCAGAASAATASGWWWRSASPRWPRRRSCSWATGPRAPWPSASRSSWPPSRGSRRRPRGAPSVSRRSAAGIEIPKLLSLLAFHDPNATVQGLDSVPEDDRPPVGIVKVSFRAMVAIGTGLAALGAWFLWTWWRRGRLPRLALVPPRARGRRAAVGGRADRGLGHHRGGAPAVGRLRGDAHRAGRDRGGRDPGRLRRARRSSTPA